MTTDQIAEPDRLTSLADMADAAWQSVRGLAYGPTLVQATNALRNADGKREPLKVYVKACRDSIERARDDAKELNDTPPATDRLTAAAHNLADLLGSEEVGGDAGAHLNCTEALAVAEIMIAVGRTDRAISFLTGHAEGDYMVDDSHHQGSTTSDGAVWPRVDIAAYVAALAAGK